MTHNKETDSPLSAEEIKLKNKLRQRKHRAKDPEANRRKARGLYEKNRERYLEYGRKHREKNGIGND